MPIHHSPCSCPQPTSSCSRYGFMLGGKWQVCHNEPSESRDATLSAFQKSNEGPSITDKAVSLIGSAIAYAASGFEQSTPDDLSKRLAVCNLCTERRNSNCGVCGCNLHLKASWASERCPLLLWPGDNPTQSGGCDCTG